MKNVIQNMNPKYKQMLDILVKDIYKMKPDEQLPSFRKLMDDYDVSYTTVSRVLVELQGMGLIYKVQGKGIFTTGKHLEKKGKNDFSFKNSISLILPFPPGHDALIGRVLSATEQVCEYNDFLLHISVISRTVDGKVKYLNKLVESGLKGMILFLNDDIFKDYNSLKIIKNFFIKLNDKKYPYVFIDRYIEGLDANYVVVDHKIGARLSTKHLIDKGSELLYFVYNEGTERISAVKDKIVGFNETIEKNKGKCKSEVIPNKSLYKILEKLVRENRQKIGFVCNDDAIAVKIIEKLKLKKYYSGKDYYVVGYGNFRDIRKFDTVEQYPDKMGKIASEILIRKIKNSSNGQEKIRIKPILIKREK